MIPCNGDDESRARTENSWSSWNSHLWHTILCMNARTAIRRLLLLDRLPHTAIGFGCRSLPFAHLVSCMSIITSQSFATVWDCNWLTGWFCVCLFTCRLGNCKRTRSLLICSCLISMVASNSNNGTHSVNNIFSASPFVGIVVFTPYG